MVSRREIREKVIRREWKNWWKDTRKGKTLGKFGENELRRSGGMEAFERCLQRNFVEIDGKIVDGS